jgi:pyocin large subunit-like protein
MVGHRGGLPWRRLLTAALAAVAIFVYWSKVAEHGERSLARDQPGFASVQRLDEHYAKHGREFGAVSREEYLRLAQALRDAPEGGPILEAVRRDGVVTRFDRTTGAFIAVNPDRTIRTFFKPNDGERYWRRQTEYGRE